MTPDIYALEGCGFTALDDKYRHSLFIVYCLLFIVYCLLFIKGIYHYAHLYHPQLSTSA